MSSSFRLNPSTSITRFKAGDAISSTFSMETDMAESVQDLRYAATFDSSSPVVLAPGATKIVNIGKIPTNGAVMSSSAFSQGVANEYNIDLSEVLDAELEVSALLGNSQQSSSLSSGTRVIIAPLKYNQFISGNWNPSAPYHPIPENMRDTANSPRFLNIEFKNTSANPVTLSQGTVTVRLEFLQSDSNNTTEDGYPSGGVETGPAPGFPLLPSPGSIPVPPSPVEPVSDLAVKYNLLQPGAPDYGKEYKPSFTWTLPDETKTNMETILAGEPPEDKYTVSDSYMNWILYEDAGAAGWTQLIRLTHRAVTASTPLGIALNPFPFIPVNKTYRIEIQTVVHRTGYPEQTANSFLEFSGNPYPTPPPPVVNVPGKPTSLVGVGGQYEVALAWVPPVDSGGALITSYDVEMAQEESPGVPGIYVPAGSPTTASTTVTGLLDSTKYYFKVAATNSVGTGLFTNPLVVETGPEGPSRPGPPRSLVGVGKRKEIDLTWQPPLNDGGKVITGYQVQSAAGANGPWSSVGGITTSLSKIITGLADNTTFYFKVAAQNNTGSLGLGPYSSVASAKTLAPITPKAPGAPVLRSVTPGPAEATLVWEAPADPGTTTITNYKVEQAPNSGGSPGTWAVVKTLNALTVTIVGLTPNSTYWYRVSATNATGYGPTSTQKSVTPTQPQSVPSAPTEFKGAGGAKQITTTWKPPATLGGSAISSYSVGISTSASGTFVATSVAGTLLQLTITSISGSPLAENTTYFLKASATNSTGTGPFTSVISVKTNPPPPTVPGVPRDLEATGFVAAMNLTWLPPVSNGGALITSYTVRRAADNGSGAPSLPYANIATVPAPTDPTAAVDYLNVGLPNAATVFHYQVAATNSVGLGAFTAGAKGTTIASGNAPSAPTLAPLVPGINKIQATWTPGANGGVALTQYNVAISSTSATAGFAAAPGSPITNIAIKTLVITGLSASTTYWVRVNEVNAVGTSPWSNVLETKTSSASGSCDGTCAGTIEQWNGSSTSSIPVPNAGAKPLDDVTAFGAEIYWSSTGMTFGVQKLAGGPGCVEDWLLKVVQGNTVIATYSKKVIAPNNLYILNSTEGPHGKDPNIFLVPALVPETTYSLRCEPQPSSVTPICSSPPTLVIPFTTGKPPTPPSTDCDSTCSGTATQWNGTIVSTTPQNGTDKSNPNNVGCIIDWTHAGFKYGKCVTGWTIKILQTKTSTTPLATETSTTQESITVTNWGQGWNIASLTPSTTYYITITPERNSVPGCATPASLGPAPFRMGNAYAPPGPPVPPAPSATKHPQTYITTYGLPSWGKTDLVSYLSQSFYSNGKQVAAKDGITTSYNQHQSWSMVRNWAKAFFQPYVSFIADNDEVTNAMVLMGDWSPILPGAGLPVQIPTLDAPTGPKFGQVAGSQVLWDIAKSNYSYCSPNGPVDFGLSYNPETTVAPPTAVGSWWENDPDGMGCPIILDFLIPLAKRMKGKGPNGSDRIVEISVNGDVSKNGNNGAYYSLDCGNYTAADQRIEAFAPSQVILNCILDPEQTWINDEKDVPSEHPPWWGPVGKEKTQKVSFAIAEGAYNTLKSGDGAPGKPISQNNQGVGGLGTTGTVASSTWAGGTAIFSVNITMAKNPVSGKRTDGGFTITSNNPSVVKGRGDAKLYFGVQKEATTANPTDVGTLYSVTATDPSIGIFLQYWVVQQSSSTGAFASTAAIINPANVAAGGVLGQITTTGTESWDTYAGNVNVDVRLAPGVTTSSVKPILTSSTAPTFHGKNTYDTADGTSSGTPVYKHRIYKIDASWDPNKNPLPSPPTNAADIFPLKVGNLGSVNNKAVPTVYNYGTLVLKNSPAASGGVTNRALGNGAGNSTAPDGGWLPSNWEQVKAETHFPSFWNVSPASFNLPRIPGGTGSVPAATFSDPGSLIMGGGNVFIGNGIGLYTGRGTYFDAEAVTSSTVRPGLITLTGIGSGGKGTYLSSNGGNANPIGFPVDNLHQLYILIYRLNQKILKYNYTHSTANGYTGPDADLKLPFISHVHHDKESYQVNKSPEYPECDSGTGEIKTSWLMLGNTQAEINAMSPAQFEVWKRCRRQTSVAYEKYLYNRYMPAEYLPDWRTGGTSGAHGYYLPHNAGCLIPNTGNKSTDGLTQNVGAETLWSTVGKPWNVSQQRNFGTEPASTATTTGTASGIGNYSNDFNSRVKGDPRDGIQRYNMGWVNYAVTAFAYGTPPGQTITIGCSALPSNVGANVLVAQDTSGATGKVKTAANSGATSITITQLQGIFITGGKLDIYTGGTPITVNITSAGVGKEKFTSQGINEAYQELYNIGEVKPPVNLVWLFDQRTKDPATEKPIVPSPNITINQGGLTNYVDGTATGVMVNHGVSTAVTATIAAIYNASSLVLKVGSVTFPNMFTPNTQVTLTKSGQPALTATITAVYSPTANGPFPAAFITMTNESKNEYGTGVYALPATDSGTMIPNGLGSACIPGGSAPECPGPGASVFCPVGTTSVGPYYRLNAVTNTLIARIYDKYKAPGKWPFLGNNSVNVSSDIKSPALTDLWLRFDAINTGVIPLDGRGYAAAPGATGAKNGPKDTDGSFAPFQSPYVASDGTIDLDTLYNGTNSAKSALDGTKIITGSDASFKPPKGPRQAIALFANEYIGGALTLDPTARPGSAASQWAKVPKTPPPTTGPDLSPGSVDSWVGSRGMEVVVYGDLTTNAMNLAFKNVNGTVSPPFSKFNWQEIIQTNKPKGKTDFAQSGWSFASNNWGGEYNGLSALQGQPSSTTGYSLMKDFLTSAASMFTGSSDDELGQARVGLYTIGFIPETWMNGTSL